MVKLALMCKSKNFRLNAICHDSDEYRTGQWVIAKKRQKDLLGEKVILTTSRKSPAYMGGTIVGFSPLDNGKVEVLFKEDQTMVGNQDAVSHRGWGSGRGVCYV